MKLANALNAKFAATPNEAPRTLPQAARAKTAPMPTEVALVLACAMRCMLRRATPELKTLTPTPNARSKRPRNAVRLTELLGGGATMLAAPVNEAMMPAL